MADVEVVFEAGLERLILLVLLVLDWVGLGLSTSFLPAVDGLSVFGVVVGLPSLNSGVVSSEFPWSCLIPNIQQKILHGYVSMLSNDSVEQGDSVA